MVKRHVGHTQHCHLAALTRRNFFANGTINDALKLWADGEIIIKCEMQCVTMTTETKRIAELKSTRVIDLLAESIKYCEVSYSGKQMLQYLYTAGYRSRRLSCSQ